jgi:ribosomal protein L7Ae-like RNA K-turn-binding protein
MPDLSKTKSYIGFAIKSGKIVYGVDNILKTNRAYVALLDGELAPNSSKKAKAHLESKQIPYFVADLTLYLNKQNCKAIAITDANLSDAIIKQFKES